MIDVKEEKFGSRKSLLTNIFKKNNIEFISNIWIVTCRKAINKNVNTRYLVIIEGENKKDYKKILLKTNSNISVINVIINEEKKEVYVTNIRTKQEGALSYKDFKERIIELTECEYLESFAMGSKNSTPLSRFFRERMGKGFALTDIDFFLTKSELLIEEKTFVKNNFGYIGVGQCISFKEIISDVFIGVNIYIICISDNEYFIGNIDKIDCWNSEYIDVWGKMVPFKVNEISLEGILNLIK